MDERQLFERWAEGYGICMSRDAEHPDRYDAESNNWRWLAWTAAARHTNHSRSQFDEWLEHHRLTLAGITCGCDLWYSHIVAWMWKAWQASAERKAL